MSDPNSFEPSDLPAPPPVTKSKGMKTLMTCGCGCAVLLLALAIAAYFTFKYYMGPGDQVPTDHLLGEDTVYVLHMDALNQDVGAKELVAELMQAVMNIDPATLDESDQETYRDLLNSTNSISLDDVGDLLDIMPSSMTLVVDDNGTELHSTFGLNLSAASRLLKKFVTMQGEDDGWTIHPHGDFEIFEPTDEFDSEDEDADAAFIAFQHDTFFMSSDLTAMERALDRTAYDEEPGLPASSELRKDLEDLRERWLISSVLRDTPRLELPRLFSELFSTDDSPLSEADLAWLDSDFGHATTGIGFVGDDMTMRLEVDGLSEADIQQIAVGFRFLGERITGLLANEEVEFLFEVIEGTSSLAINANMIDLRSWLEREIKENADKTHSMQNLELLELELGDLDEYEDLDDL